MATRDKKEEVKKVIPAGYTEMRTGETMATAEFIERCNVWDLYYPKVLETHPAERYQQQLLAMALGDLYFVKMCAEQARDDIKKGIKSELTKPPWPDPRIIRRSKIDGKSLSNLRYQPEEPEYKDMAEPYTVSDVTEEPLPF